MSGTSGVKHLKLAETQATFRPRRTRGPWDGDAGGLQRALERAVRGDVHFDRQSRALYATDASNYRQVPIGVVAPCDAEDVEAAVAACRAFGAPILGRGGGTSLGGQCCNVAVVFDFTRYMNRILAVDPGRRLARVEPGVVLDRLNEAAEPYGLRMGPDPATHTHCTLGGMLGNNSCGVHALTAGRMADNTLALDLLTYDGLRLQVGPTSDVELERIVAEGGRRGEIYARLRGLRDRYAGAIRATYPDIPRRVSGYNLDALLPEKGFQVAQALVGTEGTCGLILEATVRLIEKPRAHVLLIVAYPSIFEAADDVPRVLEAGPTGLEGVDGYLVHNQKVKHMHDRILDRLPEGDGWLLVELAGDTFDEARARARRLERRLRRPALLIVDAGEQAKFWEVRESGLGATARDPHPEAEEAWPGWEDSAVAPERLGQYLRALQRIYDRYDYHGALYGHFGDGCLHTRIDFDLKTREGVERFRAFLDEASDLCLRMDGSLSGEHGDGQARAELLEKMFGHDVVQAFHEFKAIWDPARKMNPGKVVDADPIVSNLRLGPDYRPAEPETEFSYHRDDHSLHKAVTRCVGVGKCRREGGGVMCPSWMVTHEEQHSTRGRAHLLFEMLQGDVITSGWRSPEVKESLDLCLACKGCKDGCPVSVDMATYKAEFLAHHYRGRLRPMAAYSMGLIYWWARASSRIPRLANWAFGAPGLGRLLKRLGGIAPARDMPAFARRTFRRRFRRRFGGDGRTELSPRTVLVFPDTFTNFFHPEVGLAGVDVLEAAGFEPRIPRRGLCCGRPLYDYGMLDTARRLLRQVVDALRPELEAGVPVVAMEPSCVATFRDELPELFPHDEDALRLSKQTYTLDGFLDRFTPRFLPGRLGGAALYQAHCHHQSIMGVASERRILERLGLELEEPEPGCCGMAGSFGFERGEKHDVSLRIAEQRLLPAVRAAPEGRLLIADGFSCRTQIQQGAGRRPLHLAQVLRRAAEGK